MDTHLSVLPDSDVLPVPMVTAIIHVIVREHDPEFRGGAMHILPGRAPEPHLKFGRQQQSVELNVHPQIHILLPHFLSHLSPQAHTQ